MTEYRATLRAVQTGPAWTVIAQLLLLATLAATVGIGDAGWVAGAACAAVLDVLVVRSLLRGSGERLGPAGWVTLARATLALGVAALAADSFTHDVPAVAVVALATVALVLDFVDGQVARRTASESTLGARLDGEVDAFLILVLSLYVAPFVGWWVLAIGAARYAFLAAGWPLAWLRAPLPRREWRKVVTAVQGIALTTAAADVLPRGLARVALAVALLLLAESFGRDVWWLLRHRRESRKPVALGEAPARRGPVRTAIAGLVTVLALLLVWAALVAPARPERLTLDAFLRLPLEGVVLVGLVLALPRRARRLVPLVVGPVLGVLVLIKVLDLGFFVAFDRPFNPVEDWSYAPLGIETLRKSFGATETHLIVAAVVLVGLAALLLPTAALVRLGRVAVRHRRSSLRAAAALGAGWLMCWALGAQLVAGAPIASMSATNFALQEVRAVDAALHDHARFAAAIRRDRYRHTPGDRLLTALRGKDVLLVFLESYGQFAVQGSSIAPQVDAVLAQGTRQLHAAGFSARSGWLESPTFGGISWLAHSTLQAGVWANSKDRYDQLVASHRFTLSQAFRRAGWRVVDDVPSDDRPWPQGSSFYQYDKVYDRGDVGYRGPTYAFASMPDQYVYLALQRLELAKRHRRPLFAEIDTVSSHEPWTRIPPLIRWGDVGDGSIFNRLPVDESGVADATRGYGRSIDYSLRALFSFIEHYGRKNLVTIVLGDHQPAHVVTGFGVDHDVPVSVIAHDPSVLRRVARWGWVDGMRPGRSAPLWRMSAFRDRFLGAFSPRAAGR